MKLYLSIDLESWVYPDIPKFNCLNSHDRKKLDNGFVLESIDRILDLLGKYDQKVTFFALAEMFRWYPDSFEKIRRAGHELAYHSHGHVKIRNAKIMKEEILASKDFLSEFKPIGFRAPEIWLSEEAFAPLVEAGFRYSSSMYGGHLDFVEIKEEGLMEFPVSSFVYSAKKGRSLVYPRALELKMLATEIPFGSGYFLAALPMGLIEKFIDKFLKEDKPVFMFVHNWQIVKPKRACFPDLRYKIKHPSYFPYTISIKKKVERLAKNFQFGRMDELV